MVYFLTRRNKHMDTHVVIVGNPIDGFEIYGPFENEEEAFEYEESVDTSCWSMPLHAPNGPE
jgi:hypothetical protein